MGDELIESCFNFNCSTADGFVVDIFLFVAFNRSFLKSFREVFGTPSRSLQVVVCALLNVTCDIDVLFPKLFSFTFDLDEAGFSVTFFSGVDVLNVDFDFGVDFLALKFSGNRNLRWRRFDVRFDDFVMFSHEKRRFISLRLSSFGATPGQVSDFASLLVSLKSGIGLI